MYRRESKMDSAIIYYEKTLEAYIVGYGEESDRVASTLTDLGVSYLAIEDFNKATELLERGLEINIKIHGDVHAALVPNYAYLGQLFENKGEYEKALTNINKALAICRQIYPGNHIYTATTYTFLGNLYEKAGDFEASLDAHLKSLDMYSILLPPDHSNLGAAKLNIGLIYLGKKEFDQAVDYFSEALNIYSNKYGELHRYVANCYGNIGIAYMEKKQYEKVLWYFNKCLEIRQQLFDPPHSSISAAYYNIGDFHYRTSDIENAVLYFNKALETLGVNKNRITTPSTNAEQLLLILEAEGKSYIRKYKKENKLTDLNKAIEVFHSAVACIDTMRIKYDEYDLNILTQKDFSVYEELINANVLLGKRNNDIHIEEAFLVAEKDKSIALLKAYVNSNAKSFSSIPMDLMDEEKLFKKRLNGLENDIISAKQNQTTELDSLLILYAQESQQYDLFVSNMEKEHSGYFQMKYNFDVISVDELQKRLENDEGLIEYFVSDSSIYIFLVKNNDFKISEIKKDTIIVGQIRELRRGLYNNSAVKGRDGPEKTKRKVLIDNAIVLYNKLIGGLGNLPKKLIIIPDGALGYIPFEVLLKDAPENINDYAYYNFLGRDHIISYNYSATLWQEMKSKESIGKGLLAFAPRFKKNYELIADASPSEFRRNNLGPLKHNIPEVKNICRMANVQPLIGDSATTKAFCNLAPRSAILHLATHAKLDDRNSDFSYLAFSGVNDSTDAGKIYIRDLYNMHLPLDMVVLSACETGIGELQKGEGIISLARGFTYAGAKSIITSLWEVNDKATKMIMTDFYKNLKNGDDKATALQNAKMDYLNNEDIEDNYKHPFYWASFIAVGDMSPVKLNSGFNWWWLASALIVLFLVYIFRKLKTK